MPIGEGYSNPNSNTYRVSVVHQDGPMVSVVVGQTEVEDVADRVIQEVTDYMNAAPWRNLDYPISASRSRYYEYEVTPTEPESV